MNPPGVPGTPCGVHLQGQGQHSGVPRADLKQGLLTVLVAMLWQQQHSHEARRSLAVACVILSGLAADAAAQTLGNSQVLALHGNAAVNKEGDAWVVENRSSAAGDGQHAVLHLMPGWQLW